MEQVNQMDSRPDTPSDVLASARRHLEALKETGLSRDMLLQLLDEDLRPGSVPMTLAGGGMGVMGGGMVTAPVQPQQRELTFEHPHYRPPPGLTRSHTLPGRQSYLTRLSVSSTSSASSGKASIFSNASNVSSRMSFDSIGGCNPNDSSPTSTTAAVNVAPAPSPAQNQGQRLLSSATPAPAAQRASFIPSQYDPHGLSAQHQLAATRLTAQLSPVSPTAIQLQQHQQQQQVQPQQQLQQQQQQQQLQPRQPPQSPLSTSSSTTEKRYWCTSCETSFKRKYDWKRHEEEFHERWKKYPCPECNRSFWGANTFNQHHKTAHGCQTCPHADSIVKYVKKKRAWACGFCAAFLPERERYFNHVAKHFEEGKTKNDWYHSYVIYGLLHQPVVHEAWKMLRTRRHGDNPARQPHFSWSPLTTARAQGFMESDHPGQLQDFLEFFSGTKADAEQLALFAYERADVVLRSRHTPPTSPTSDHVTVPQHTPSPPQQQPQAHATLQPTHRHSTHSKQASKKSSRGSLRQSAPPTPQAAAVVMEAVTRAQTFGQSFASLNSSNGSLGDASAPVANALHPPPLRHTLGSNANLGGSSAASLTSSSGSSTPTQTVRHRQPTPLNLNSAHQLQNPHGAPLISPRLSMTVPPELYMGPPPSMPPPPPPTSSHHNPHHARNTQSTLSMYDKELPPRPLEPLREEEDADEDSNIYDAEPLMNGNGRVSVVGNQLVGPPGGGSGGGGGNMSGTAAEQHLSVATGSTLLDDWQSFATTMVDDTTLPTGTGMHHQALVAHGLSVGDAMDWEMVGVGGPTAVGPDASPHFGDPMMARWPERMTVGMPMGHGEDMLMQGAHDSRQ